MDNNKNEEGIPIEVTENRYQILRHMKAHRTKLVDELAVLWMESYKNNSSDKETAMAIQIKVQQIQNMDIIIRVVQQEEDNQR